jgi:hypothetical protein
MEKVKKSDCYETPKYLADWAVSYAHSKLVLQNRSPVAETLTMLEPGCGATAPFGRVAAKLGYDVSAVEKRDILIIEDFKLFAGFTNADFLTWNGAGFDMIATNPPYSCAEPFIRRSLSLLKTQGIAIFLLRLGFLASLKRRPLFRDRPPMEVHVLQKRPSFSKDGNTDATEYAFFVWGGTGLAVSSGSTKLYWLDNKSLYDAYSKKS